MKNTMLLFSCRASSTALSQSKNSFFWFPKVHEISKLLEILKELGVNEIEKLYKENEKIIELLELAYVSSRYPPFSFSREEAEASLNFVKKLREMLWKEQLWK